jgi:hypothetical protein
MARHSENAGGGRQHSRLGVASGVGGEAPYEIIDGSSEGEEDPELKAALAASLLESQQQQQQAEQVCLCVCVWCVCVCCLTFLILHVKACIF